MSSATLPSTLHVACLCAAWCRLCDSDEPVFRQAVAQLQAPVQAHWIDIEDAADLVGDFDLQTFPTLVIADDRRVWFAGPLPPQPETLQRVLRAAAEAAAGSQSATAPVPEVEAFAQRLRHLAADQGLGPTAVPSAGPTTSSS